MHSLATVHGYSADALPFSRELYAAEEEAKKAKRNVGSPNPGLSPCSINQSLL